MATQELSAWKDRSPRKPLIIRGARQVGKTHLVEAFGRARFEGLVTLNFEREPRLSEVFDRPDPRETLRILELMKRQPISPGKTLLFLDEVQAAPAVLGRLRDFAEELPELHVVAAGSLLDFVLADHRFSMPVGRIGYLHLEPMTFAEFLMAVGENALATFLVREVHVGTEVPAVVHERLMKLFQTYTIVGGMPAAVRVWVGSGSLLEVQREQQDLIATFRDDFAKYGPRVNRDRLHKVFDALPRLVGRKFVAAHVNREEKSGPLQEAFRMLCLARIASPVERTHANGVPLAGEVDERYRKVCLLDVGLYSALSGLDTAFLGGALDLQQVNAGQLAEQAVGQALRADRPPFRAPELFCWAREQRTSNAEVDYVLQHGPHVVPVEVKAGETGRLRSLQLFLREKGRGLGLRLWGRPPALVEARTSLPDGAQVPFRLLNLPLYLAGEAQRLLGEALGQKV